MQKFPRTAKISAKDVGVTFYTHPVWNNKIRIRIKISRKKTKQKWIKLCALNVH